MRGAYATDGSFRLLMAVFGLTLLCFCRPIRNKLYIPLLLWMLCMAFAAVNAATDQKWALIAAGICYILALISLGVQQFVIRERHRKAAIEAERQAEKDRSKRKKSIHRI